MTNWHRYKEADETFLRLMDALCTWERETGRGSKLFFFPDADDEQILFIMDGKPVNWDLGVLINQLELMRVRLSGEKTK